MIIGVSIVTTGNKTGIIPCFFSGVKDTKSNKKRRETAYTGQNNKQRFRQKIKSIIGMVAISSHHGKGSHIEPKQICY